MESKAIINLWKRPDGTLCVVSKRENVLYISVERNGIVLKQQTVDSPQDAMKIAREWEASMEDA